MPSDKRSSRKDGQSIGLFKSQKETRFSPISAPVLEQITISMWSDTMIASK